MNQKKVLVTLIFILVALGVGVNLKKQSDVDRSKLPEKVEMSRGFQRWITNLKNKDVDIEADEFRFIEDAEIFNTQWIKVTSLDSPELKTQTEASLTAHQNIKKIIFSPGERSYIDYRNEIRDGYGPSQVRYFGIRDEKLIDARVVECFNKNGCIFDRGFFIDNSNDVFVISELSLADETDGVTCLPTDACEYSFKLYMVDLVNNLKVIFESKPRVFVLADLLKGL